MAQARETRDETDNNLVQKLNSSIDLLQEEITKSLVQNHVEGQEELEQLLERDIPKLQYELANESALRKDLEIKIKE